ncbi:unnamed protein product, partial [Soboliphyme baturini]|uniref:FAD_binding_3 domain-containing protein n=1 Tax=Soboliphyme baturini TaxID=241478 RepID=A0A183IP71_9BILA
MFQDVGASTVFDSFLSGSSFRDVITTFNQLCSLLNLDPTDPENFFFNLTESLTSWKAQNLKELFRKRALQPEYGQQKLCCNARVLIVGAGPCGLRMAIECALLGCKTVVVEKRARFTRNNVLHIWPFLIEDLRSLGAKLFYPKFCPGSINHISICHLQYILLKVALLLGVEIHEGVSVVQLVPPTNHEDGIISGWRAEVSPRSHQLTDYEFDVFVNANGQHTGVPGIRWKEFRGKLAIAITANFVNNHTEDEERVPEISGVAYIFKQQFFRQMREKTGIDLENIVYYKDETHYFV